MSKVNIILIDEHPVVRSGIMSLLAGHEDFEITDSVKNVDAFLEKLKHWQANYAQIVIFDSYSSTDLEVENIKNIKKAFGKILILVLVMYPNENFILKLIKAGAKGILSSQVSRDEFVEAILTLQNGYEYLGKYITNIVLNSYLKRSTGQEETAQLSVREIEVLKLFGEGQTNQEIADQLFISIRTVESHKSNIMRKINVRTTVDLVKFAIRNNIVEI